MRDDFEATSSSIWCSANDHSAMIHLGEVARDKAAAVVRN
jgi:hypothetical protein